MFPHSIRICSKLSIIINLSFDAGSNTVSVIPSSARIWRFGVVFRTVCYIAMFSFFEEVSSRRSLGFTQHGERMLLRQVSQLPLNFELILAHQKSLYLLFTHVRRLLGLLPAINVPAINVQDKQII